MKRIISLLLATVLLTSVCTFPTFGKSVERTSEFNLELSSWKLKSSKGLPDDATVSAPTFDTSSWYNATVPGTVLGALIDNGVYDSIFEANAEGKKDVYYNENLSKINPTDFADPFWYSTSFNLPQTEKQPGKKVLLTFSGINYTADIYINGQKLSNDKVTTKEDVLKNRVPEVPAVADPLSVTGPGTMKTGLPTAPFNDSDYNVYSKQFIGTLRTYELDVTSYAVAGSNTISVKITKPMYTLTSTSFTDLALTWVDWAQQPADNSMGLIGKVTVSTSYDVRLNNPMAASKVAEDNKSADLTLYTDINNMSAAAVSGVLTATVKDPQGGTIATINKNVTVAPSAYCQEVKLSTADSAALHIVNPQLWWPYLSGDQPMYTVDYSFAVGGIKSDSMTHKFGIREISGEINLSPLALGSKTSLAPSASNQEDPSNVSFMMQVYVNHKPVLLRGGGYTPTDFFMRHNKTTNQAVVDYVKYMGMNMVRDEGKFFDDDLLDTLDANGILLLDGWCCCERWQNSQTLNKGERFIAYESLYAQLRRLRSHTSLAIWLNGSDEPPSLTNANANYLTNAKSVERTYSEIEAQLRYHETGLISSSAAALPSSYAGNAPGGLHMNESYNYMSPAFYYSDPKGALGFVSEGGPGPSLPTVETFKKMIPADKLWPYNVGDGTITNYNTWNMHSARGSFTNLGDFTRAMDNHYAGAKNLDQYLMKAQIQQYEAQRAQYEAFNVKRFANTTGKITWMLNNPWPETYWNTFDFYMNPNGSTFGARIANEPVHIMYDPYNKEISVVNSTFKNFGDLTATATIYNIDGKSVGTLSKTVNVVADGATPTKDFSVVGGVKATREQKKVGLVLNSDGTYSDKTYTYYGMIEKSTGVTKMWTKADIMGALQQPTTDVYFLRLELKDKANNSVSVNTYAVPMQEDIIKASAHDYRLTPHYQYADLTKLNELPTVTLDATQSTQQDNTKVIKTVTITNDATKNNGAIAYSVYMKAFKDAGKTQLVAPVFFSDNMFTLFPGESRTVTVSYDKSVLSGDATIDYTCYNNVCNDVPSRVATLRTSGNLALNKSLLNGGGTDATDANAAALAAGVTAGDVSTSWVSSATQTSPTVDLGAVKKIDRVKLRWLFGNRPNTVEVQVAITDTAPAVGSPDWISVITQQNPNGHTMNDIVLPAGTQARFVKVIPTGYRGAIPGTGAMTGIFRAGSAGGNGAATTFQLNSFEVYSYKNTALLNIVGQGTINANDVDYTNLNNANERAIVVGDDNTIKLKFTPKIQNQPMKILRDGVDITASLDANKAVTLTDITKDTQITANFGTGDGYSLRLKDWKISTSDGKVDADVAKADYDTSGWTGAKVPGTVLGALLDAGKYDSLFTANAEGKKDVFFSDNLSKIPFADFDKPWWYSTSFSLPSDQIGKKTTLTFKGISYVAEIYVNGQKLENKNITIKDENLLKNNPPEVATAADPTGTSAVPATVANDTVFTDYNKLFKGAFRTYELDITDYVNAMGTDNNIKVKVAKPLYNSGGDDDANNDLAVYWVDWNPQPPDNNMGLIGESLVSTSGNVRLANPAVVSKVSTDLKTASLTFYVDASNLAATLAEATLHAVVKDPSGNVVADVSKNIDVAGAAYNQEVSLSSSDFTQLTLRKPELWWPYMSGDQPMYTVTYTISSGGVQSDTLVHRFGVREVTTEVNVSAFANGNAATVAAGSLANMMQVYVNHKPIALKGGGYCPTDLFLRHSQRANKAVIDYVKYMGFNMVRDEGKFFDNDLLTLMDENGILLMTGWCCCDRFQAPQLWTKAERFIAYESQYAQLRNARQHPAMVLWYNGSDNPPGYGTTNAANGKTVERRYLEIAADVRFSEIGAICSSGSAKVSTYTGVTGGQHMDDTYDYQSITFPYSDPKGQYGFISEGGGGPSIPVLETMKKIIPSVNLWPYNTSQNLNVWNYHSTRGSFSDISQFQKYLESQYGAAANIEEYVMKAQVQEYDYQRSQYEALGVNKFTNTSGFVNWMLNNAWPILYWNQFDFYMNPNGSTYGARKGNEPVHIMYDPYNKDIYVINNTFESYSGLTATATIYDLNGNVINTAMQKSINVVPDGSTGTISYKNTSQTPKKIGFTKGVDGKYVDLNYNYYGQIEKSFGVNKLWSKDDIQKSLIKPTTDVYFVRLELKDMAGKVISYNSYPVASKNDVTKISAHSWNRTPNYQYADFTQLNQLPAVDLTSAQITSNKTDEKVVQTIHVSNATDKIAYAVELKAYTDSGKTTLVAPVLFDDNLFTLFPGESRDITVSHNVADLAGDATVTVNCYNNVIQSKPARVANIRSTRNLALNKVATGSGGGTPANAVNVAAAAVTAATNYNGSILDADATTNWANTNDAVAPWIYVNLGDKLTFDRVTLRWNFANRPDKVVIDVSDDGATWTKVTEYNNVSGSTMNDIIFDNQVKAQYVRVSPTGYRGAAAAVGMNASAVSGRSGIGATAASRAFQLAAFEVYGFRNSVILEVQGNGKVMVSDVAYTKNNTANERVVMLDQNNTVTLTFTPDVAKTAVKVYRDGTDITDMMNRYNMITLTGVDKDTTISALFDGAPTDRFSVDFDSAGGSAVASIDVAKLGDKIVKPVDPVKGGYAFGGWFTDEACTKAWNFDVDTLKTDMKLYANWTPDGSLSFTVQFDARGGNAVNAMENLPVQSKIAEPAAPVRTGYNFAGWFKEPTCVTAWNFASDMVSANTTLYAKWELAPGADPNLTPYVVSFDTLGGSYVPSDTVTSGSAISVPSVVPTKDGSRFINWFADASGTTPWDFATKIMVDTTLYAKWAELKYSVTFNSDGGSDVTTISELAFGDKITKPEDPTKEGAVFESWYKDEARTQKWNFASDTIATDTTLYAKWVPKTYVVQFSSMGGSNVSSIPNVQHGAKIQKPINPSYAGFDFVNWFKATDFTTPWNFDTDVVTEDLMLYAKWDLTVVPVPPTEEPTTAPTQAPTQKPTTAPTTVPTTAPTTAPTAVPTTAPTQAPTTAPTATPIPMPTPMPTATPGSGGGSRGGGGGGGGGVYVNNPPAHTTEQKPLTAAEVETASKNQQAIQASLKDKTSPAIALGEASDLVLNADTVAALITANVPLTVKKDNVAVQLDAKTLKEVNQDKANVKLGINTLNDKDVKDALEAVKQASYKNVVPSSDLTAIKLLVNNVGVSAVTDPMTVTLGLTDKNLTEDQLQKLTAIQINVDGTIDVLGGKVDAEQQSFTFTATESGIFGVAVLNDLKVLTLSLSSSAYKLNGQENQSDVAPAIVGGRAMVPIRFIAESLGANVGWEKDTKTVTITLDGKTLQFKVGEKVTGMDVPAQIIGERTVVPLRFISEFFGAKVDYNEEAKTIQIVK